MSTPSLSAAPVVMGSVESKPLDVLMLAPYFPPRQRVGALRPARFVNWLPQAGIRPWVACLSSGDDATSGGGTGEGELFPIRAPWDRTRSGASQSDLGGARPARKRTVFDALADAVDREEAKVLLRRNGQEERGHAHRLLKAIDLLGGEFTLPADADNPYVQPMDLAGIINADLLNIIQQSEQDGDLQYQAWADAESNQHVAKILRQNGAEETRHGERVAQVVALLG